MCKVLMMAGIKDPEKAWKFARAALPAMTKRDKDGVGYVAAGEGTIAGERWLNPKEAFKVRKSLTSVDQRLKRLLGKAVDITQSYNCFGDAATIDHAQAILLHTRMATCGKGIENTHPFVSGSTALIHNGIISNAHKLSNITSTCDSETILNEYLLANVSESPESMSDVANALEGYYACGVISESVSGQYLDIFKDYRASLVVGYVEELQTFVFCTTEEILRAAAKSSKMHLTGVHAVNAGYLIRLDVSSGQALSITPFSLSKSINYSSPRSWRGDEMIEGETGREDITREVTRRLTSKSYNRAG